MESGRIEADWDSELALIAKYQFEWGLGLDDVMKSLGRDGAGTDMNR
jgi:hypothetical protein